MEYLKGITHCTFQCNHYEKMVEFYRDILGLKQIFTTPLQESRRKSLQKLYPDFDLEIGEEWMTYLEIAPHNFIELFRIPYQGSNDTRATGFHHVCLMVEDIVEAARHLEKQGIQLWQGPSWKGKPFEGAYPENPVEAGMVNPIGILSFHVNDPEGNQLEFMQYTAGCLPLQW